MAGNPTHEERVRLLLSAIHLLAEQWALLASDLVHGSAEQAQLLNCAASLRYMVVELRAGWNIQGELDLGGDPS